MPLGGSGASPERAPKSEGNGAPAPAPAPAAAAPAGPQAVTLTGPAPIQGVLAPAQIYEAVSAHKFGFAHRSILVLSWVVAWCCVGGRSQASPSCS